MENQNKDNYRLSLPLRSQTERNYVDELGDLLENSPLSGVEKMMNFSLYTPRQNMASFITKYELFKKVLDVQGSIIECGVAYGSGTMAFANLSSIFEPVNYNRKIIGFDTFSGFPSLSGKDKVGQDPHAEIGGMKVESYEEIQKCIKLFDQNRFIGHINKVELVKGDVMKTVPEYIQNNPHLVVSLLYLDLDLYEPTKLAIELFLPRMPKGAIIGFDELNHPDWPGETTAVMEALGIANLRIKRFPFDSVRSYAVIE
jgi:hypothetical protein